MDNKEVGFTWITERKSRCLCIIKYVKDADQKVLVQDKNIKER